MTDKSSARIAAEALAAIQAGAVGAVNEYRRIVIANANGIPIGFHADVLENAGHEAAGALRELAVALGQDIATSPLRRSTRWADLAAEYEALFARGHINSRMASRYIAQLSDLGRHDTMQCWTDPSLVRRCTLTGFDVPAPGEVAELLLDICADSHWRETTQASQAVFRIGNLQTRVQPILTALFRAIESEVDCYLSRLDGSARAVMDWAPPDREIKSWALISKGPGHSKPHLHPRAWVSGVYYPQVPQAIRESEAGWLSIALEGEHSSAPIQIQPEPGLLILFPSYALHWTTPYSGSDTRIAVAIDVTGRVV